MPEALIRETSFSERTGALALTSVAETVSCQSPWSLPATSTFSTTSGFEIDAPFGGIDEEWTILPIATLAAPATFITSSDVHAFASVPAEVLGEIEAFGQALFGDSTSFGRDWKYDEERAPSAYAVLRFLVPSIDVESLLDGEEAIFEFISTTYPKFADSIVVVCSPSS